MVSTDDVHDMDRRVEKARENLADAPMDADDRDAIVAFADHRQVAEDVAASTLKTDLTILRLAAERAAGPLLAFGSLADVNALLRTNRETHGISPATNDNYRRVLRVFFGWLDGVDDHGAYPWWEDLTIPSRDTEPLDPAEVLDVDEVHRLRDAADHPREKALIEFLADTGMRVAAALQLRRGDIDGLDGKRPTVAVNREGEAQKGMDPLPRPIIHSRRWLRLYLNDHHPDDHDDAAAFATKHYASRDRGDGAIHPSTIIGILKDLAEDAGIDPDRVNAHAFRHVATTRMRRDMDMDWDDIAHRTGWSERSLSQMKRTYAHLTNEDRNDRVWAAAGVDDGRDAGAVDNGPAVADCINCGRSIDAASSYCPECGADQSGGGTLEEQVMEALAALDGEDARELLDGWGIIDRDPDRRVAARDDGE